MSHYKEKKWPHYGVHDSGLCYSDLYPYRFYILSGLINYIKYLICRYWHGRCDFSGGLKNNPTYFRPKICKRCGSKWEFNKQFLPPVKHMEIRYECPSCLNYTDQGVTEETYICQWCGYEFESKEPRWIEIHK